MLLRIAPAQPCTESSVHEALVILEKAAQLPGFRYEKMPQLSEQAIDLLSQATVQFHSQANAPDKQGLVLFVRMAGKPIVTLHCINVAQQSPMRLKWSSKNAAGTASVASYFTREEAVGNVAA